MVTVAGAGGARRSQVDAVVKPNPASYSTTASYAALRTASNGCSWRRVGARKSSQVFSRDRTMRQASARGRLLHVELDQAAGVQDRITGDLRSPPAPRSAP